jgi:hypothetical protein
MIEEAEIEQTLDPPDIKSVAQQPWSYVSDHISITSQYTFNEDNKRKDNASISLRKVGRITHG